MLTANGFTTPDAWSAARVTADDDKNGPPPPPAPRMNRVLVDGCALSSSFQFDDSLLLPDLEEDSLTYRRTLIRPKTEHRLTNLNDGTTEFLFSDLKDIVPPNGKDHSAQKPRDLCGGNIVPLPSPNRTPSPRNSANARCA
jgi:hypothetical protein